MSQSVLSYSAESPELVLAPVEQLAGHPDNPRRSLGDLRELTASIRAHGVLEPLIVVPADVLPTAAGRLAPLPAGVRWVIVAGHRRHAAAVKARAAVVPVLPRPDLADPAAALEVMLAENVQRSALTPVEEARAFARLRQAGRSQREIAGRLGCAQSQVSKRLAVLDLPQAAQAAVDSGRLALADAAEVLRLRKHREDLAELVDELLSKDGPRWTGERLRAVVDGELAGIEARENNRRLLAQAEARGARILDPAAGQLPPYPLRRLLHDPQAIDAAGLAGTLGAYLGGDGRVCYLDLAAAAVPAVEAEPVEEGDWPDDDGGVGPDEVSGGGITVRRVDPSDPPTTAALAAEEARREAAAEREQREAAELARDEVCQRLVAGFAADPTASLPFLAGHVLSDTAGDGFSYTDTGRVEGWLAVAGLVVFGEDDEPEVFGWLDRTADPATRLLGAGALALAAAERRLIQHAAYGGWDVHDLAHLDGLVAAGHVLSDWEQHRIDQAHISCTATDGCGQPYGHPGNCDRLLDLGQAEAGTA